MSSKRIILFISISFIGISMFAESQTNIPLELYQQKTLYKIKNGETLAHIANTHQVSVAYLLTLNKEIYDPDRIYADQQINVPNKQAILQINKDGETFTPLVKQLGAEKYPDRKNAILSLIKLDWQAVPLLLKALHNDDPEIRENAREVLRALHRKKVLM